jgi:hypothetical protein
MAWKDAGFSRHCLDEEEGYGGREKPAFNLKFDMSKMIRNIQTNTA